MIERFDIIVVGAGPGGSVAATVAARSGLKTLLVDRDVFPREKACGDAVPEPAFLLMRELGITDGFFDDFFEIDFIRLVGPNGKQIKLAVFPQSGEKTRIVQRQEFDDVLRQHAIRSGAEFRTLNVLEPVLEADKVVGIKARVGHSVKDFRSQLVIAADGATSAIARGLNPGRRPDNHVSISLRGYISTNEPLDNTIELAFIRDLMPGYGWVFPLGKHRANIGVGLRLDTYKQKRLPLSHYLQTYLDTPAIRTLVGDNRVENLKSWQLPNCSMEQKRVFDGAILIGDAGGFVNPLTGAGIYPAMATGCYAAEVGARAIRDGDLSADNLVAFETLWRRELQMGMHYSGIAQRLMGTVPALVDVAVTGAQLFPGVMRKILAKV